MGGLPPFANETWRKRESKARPNIRRRVFYDPKAGREYEADPNPSKQSWHEINWRDRTYREIDPETGSPVSGREGEWRHLS